MQDAVIVSAVRTAVGKANKGALAHVRPEELGTAAVREAVRRAAPLAAEDVDDVIMGCAMPEGPQGLNMGRIIALRAGLPDSVTAQTVNRFCSSGLQSIALGAQQIMAGMGDVIVAGGTESMSAVPMSGFCFRPDPWMAEHLPEAYVAMGITAENVARKFGVSREDADAFASRSHERALAAIRDGKFKDEIVPLEVERVDMTDGERRTSVAVFDVDEGPRPGSTPEVLARLRPAFHARGTVTAGNSSQTSDGAGAVVVMSRRKAEELGLAPLARFVSFAVGGVAPEVMGIGPVKAIPKALGYAGLKVDDLDLVELNEAFACQALAVIREAGLDPEKTNVNGGAVALGHPIGASGARILTTLLYAMQRRSAQRGIAAMCMGGGNGVALAVERA
jgi:acetyl-CoA acyltransferase